MSEFPTPGPATEILLGTVIMILIIFVHGVGLRLIGLHFSRSWTNIACQSLRGSMA